MKKLKTQTHDKLHFHLNYFVSFNKVIIFYFILYNFGGMANLCYCACTQKPFFFLSALIYYSYLLLKFLFFFYHSFAWFEYYKNYSDTSFKFSYGFAVAKVGFVGSVNLGMRISISFGSSSRRFISLSSRGPLLLFSLSLG